jgi:hypothetical protein
MAFLLDNLTASVIAGTVILILGSMQMRATNQRVAQQSQQIMQNRARELTTWLERDLARVGENMTGDEEAIPETTEDGEENPKPFYENPDDGTQEWVTEEFVFERDSIESGTLRRVETQYRIDAVDTREIDGEEKSIYQLTRKWRIDDGNGNWSDWEEEGGSAAGLEYFEVDLLDRNALPTKNLDEVKSIRVRFSVAAPFQNEELSFPASRANVVVGRYRLGGS